ncbi:MAG: hypothetical protein VB050_04430 [Geobacteraceae bacterium]|nr:hypothetical protein [Geobacteraceae bacterium]
MKVYKPLSPELARIMMPFVLVLMAFVPLAIIVRVGQSAIMLGVLSIPIVWALQDLLRTVDRVTVHEDGGIEWATLIRSVKIAPDQIIGFKRSIGSSFVTVEHTGGKLKCSEQIHELDELMAYVRRQNPCALLKVC